MEQRNPVRSGIVVPDSAQLAKWWAVFTLSRQERIVEDQIQRRGLETWLPLVPKLTRWSDRRKLINRPLFPQYLFVRCADTNRNQAFGIAGMVRYVGNKGTASAIDSTELDAVREVLRRQLPCERYSSLAVGQRVRVVRGPLMGMCGKLIRHGKGYRLVIAIEAMGQAIASDVESCDVEAD